MSAGPASSRTTAPARLLPLRWWQLPALLPLEQALFPSDPWTAAQWWSELAGVPERRAILAAWRPESDPDAAMPHDLLGFVDVAVTRDVADLQTIGVAPAAQGAGLGRLLLRAALDQAAARGCRRMLLEVRAGNVAAVGLYESAGFEPIDRRRGYYPDGEDAVIMQAGLR